MEEVENYTNMLRQDKVDSLIKTVFDAAEQDGLTLLEVLQAVRSIELSISVSISESLTSEQAT